MVKLFIDCGHGGSDSGALGNGLQEKNLTLQIAKAIKSKLSEYQNIQVRLSRISDVTLSLSQRTNMANSWGADALLSIHINAGASSARGFESYIYPSVGAKTIQFQDILHTEIWNLIDNYSDHNRGKKRANFHMLRESNMIALLTENLFISNSADANLLKSNNFIDALAQGHVNGIVRYFGLKKNETNPAQPTQPITGKVWHVQIGAFSNKENADNLADKVKAKGHNVFVKQEGELYVVQVGVFKNKDLALKMKEVFEKEGHTVYLKEES